MALDGNLDTAWLTDFTARPAGQWWQTTLTSPTTIGNLVLVQPQTGSPDQWISRVTITFDGRHPVTVPLGAASRTPATVSCSSVNGSTPAVAGSAAAGPLPGGGRVLGRGRHPQAARASPRAAGSTRAG